MSGPDAATADPGSFLTETTTPASSAGFEQLPLADDSGPGAAGLGLLAALLLALVGAAWLNRRRGGVGASGLRLLGTCALGSRRSAALLRVGSRVVLVGVAEGSVRRLGEWDAEQVGALDEAAGALGPDAPPAPEQPEGGGTAPPLTDGAGRRFARALSRALGALAIAFLIPAACSAQGFSVNVTGPNDWEPGRLSAVVEIAALVTLVTFIPAVLLTATCFTRFVIVFHFVRQALGVPETPPNQVLVGLSLFLTAFVMAPVGQQAWQEGIEPYRDGELTIEQALERSAAPMKDFMMRNTRQDDLRLIYRIADDPLPATRADVSLRHLLPAFVISELNTAFLAGFLIFLPFLVIDVIVAAVLLSMGMMMMPPVMVSMPLKVMVFVLAGGWHLLVGSFVAGIR